MAMLGTKLMQISFRRLPEEHADDMIRAGRHFLSPVADNRLTLLLYMGGAIGFGLVFSLALELYRQFVLAPIFGIEALPAFPVIVLELLPVAAAIVGGAILQRRVLAQMRRNNLAASLDREVMIDIDIYRGGMVMTGNAVVSTFEWTAFRRIESAGGVLTFYGEDCLFTIPARAFENQSAYLTQGHEIIRLWKEARRSGFARADEKKAAATLDVPQEKEH